MFISNIWPNSTPLQDIILQHLSEPDFDLSRPFKAKRDSVIGLPIHGFLVVSNSDLWPKSARLRDIILRNLSDLDFDLSRSLNSNVIDCHWTPYMVSY